MIREVPLEDIDGNGGSESDDDVYIWDGDKNYCVSQKFLQFDYIYESCCIKQQPLKTYTFFKL